MNCPKAALFDLDDTLAESFQPPKEEMIERVAKLLALMPFAILSGAGFGRIKEQLLDPLTKKVPDAVMFAFPDSASLGYVYERGLWEKAYSQDFTQEEIDRITEVLSVAVAESGILGEHQAYEPRTLVAPTQVRYAALGLEAPEEEKVNWDPDKAKRTKLKEILSARLPDCEILIGGRTTLDITRKNVDKAYGVRWLSQRLAIEPADMRYIGDALYEGGNDHVVIATGVQTRETSGPAETLTIIDELLSSCATR